MSIVDPLESAAHQYARARLDEAERVRLARSLHHPRAPRRTAASLLRHLADRIEPAPACADC